MGVDVVNRFNGLLVFFVVFTAPDLGSRDVRPKDKDRKAPIDKLKLIGDTVPLSKPLSL